MVESWFGSEKGVKWKKWEFFCQHKNDGGMGFQNLHVFNIAMLGKICLRIQMNLDALLNCILKAWYIPRNSPLGSVPNYTWRGIHMAKDLIGRGTRWKVGDGSRVRMLGDNWLNDDKSFWIHSPAIPTFEDMVVSDFYVPETWSWNRDLIEKVFLEEDALRIFKTSPSPIGVPNKIIWHFSPKGIYSVKIVFHLAMKIILDKWCVMYSIMNNKTHLKER